MPLRRERMPGVTGIDQRLAQVRAGLTRLTPEEAAARVTEGRAVLIDTRTETQMAEHGLVPGALAINRTILEWRLDPTSGHALPIAHERLLCIVLCQEGYSSSLAAASLQSVGVEATDVIGGVDAWIAAGLPLRRATD